MEITYYLYYKLYYLYYKLYCADNFGSVTVSDKHKLIGRRSWVVQREVESKQAVRARCMASYSQWELMGSWWLRLKGRRN